MTNVIRFTGTTIVDLEPDTFLENLKGKLDNFVLAGWDTDGKFYISSTTGKNSDIVYLLTLGMRAALTFDE